MEELVRKIAAEFGFKLTEDEIRLIVRQAEAHEKLFQPLYRVDLDGVMPMMKIDRRSPTGGKADRERR